MKVNRNIVMTYCSFILSPFLSLPFLWVQLRKGVDKGAVFLISILMGMLSAKYIPTITNDKSRYIERYDLFSNYSFTDLITYFVSVSRPDYLFDSLNYFFSRLGFDVRYFFFIITFLTVYLNFIFLKKMVDKSCNGSFIYNNTTFLLVLSSISFIGLFSGMRFAFAGSFFLGFIYLFYFSKSYIRAFLLLVITLSIHFSYALLITGIFLTLFNPKAKTIKFFLILSLLFFILPKGVLEGILGALSLPSGYSSKADIYINLDRESSENGKILTYIKNAWFYFAILHLLLHRPHYNNKLYIIVSILAIFINFMYPVPIAFNRYIVFYKIIFAGYLIYMILTNNIKRSLFYGFLFLYIVGLSTDMLVLRVNFSESYNLSEIWSIFYTFAEAKEPHKFLY